MQLSKATEQDSIYNYLEKMRVSELLSNIYAKDKTAAFAIKKGMHQIEAWIKQSIPKLKAGGQLFNIRTGTIGRLGIVDASEGPPTFGVSHDLAVGLLFGEDSSIRNAVEFAEDSTQQGSCDLQKYDINSNDVVIGIAASGTAPYLTCTLEKCNQNNIVTTCITCNHNSPLAHTVQFPVDVIRTRCCVGQIKDVSRFSTEISAEYDFYGHNDSSRESERNKMMHIQLNNNKSANRSLKMIITKLKVCFEEAKNLLAMDRNIRSAIQNYEYGN